MGTSFLLALSTLILPGGLQSQLQLQSHAVGPLEVFYQDDILEGEEGKLWVRSLGPTLEKGYGVYRTLHATGLLPQCKAPGPKMPRFSLYLLTSLRSPENNSQGPFLDVAERRGYDHPSNKGPLVQAVPWDESAIRGLILHEAFHRWCSSPNHDQVWVEEGAADMLAYQVQGILPQMNITRYFGRPKRASLYGGSFLWWLSVLEATRLKADFMETLAALHLGLREDLIFGSLFNAAKDPSAKTDFPYGEISAELPATPKTKPPTTASRSIPYWKQPWGMITLRASRSDEAPAGYFIWNGPSL